jgi:hypothetical protein
MYSDVQTDEEVKLFHQLLPQHTKDRKTDYISMAAAWNLHVYRAVEASPASCKHVYLKTDTHLKTFADTITTSMHMRDASVCSDIAASLGPAFPRPPPLAGQAPSATTRPTIALAAPASWLAPFALPAASTILLASSLQASMQSKLTDNLVGAGGQQAGNDIRALFGAGGGQAGGGGTAAAAAAAAGGTAAAQQQPQQQASKPRTVGEYKALLRQQAEQEDASTRQAAKRQREHAYGKGRGGAGSMKLCWPCTSSGQCKDKAEGLRQLADAVVLVNMDYQHQQSCPFCKRSNKDCKAQLRYKSTMAIPDGFKQNPVCRLREK